MNRAERRVLAGEMRKQAKAWPEHLVEVPESEWPVRRPDFYTEWPVKLWRSRQYLVQVFEAPAVGVVDCVRLSVNRVTVRGDMHWQDDIPWVDLQRCKREVGLGDWYAVEVYPRDRDIVNVANMRHLWCLSQPLEIGWFS